MANIIRRPIALAKVVTAAQAWLGTPYHDLQSVKGVGCDCLGLARGVWRDLIGQEPVAVPPYSRDWGEAGSAEILALGVGAHMIEAPTDDLKPGTVVIFRMRERAIAKHVGIMAAPDRFIHAREKLGVIEEEMTRAWRRRVAYAFLYPQPRRGG